MVQRYGVEHRVWFRLTPHVTARSMRAYRGQPARVAYDRDTTVEGGVDTATLEATMPFGQKIETLYGKRTWREHLATCHHMETS